MFETWAIITPALAALLCAYSNNRVDAWVWLQDSLQSLIFFCFPLACQRLRTGIPNVAAATLERRQAACRLSVDATGRI